MVPGELFMLPIVLPTQGTTISNFLTTIVALASMSVALVMMLIRILIQLPVSIAWISTTRKIDDVDAGAGAAADAD